MSKNTNRPRYSAFSVKEQKGGKNHYTKIGVAFEIQEGSGLSISLDALPVGDRILLFEYKETSSDTAKALPAPTE